MNQLEKNLERSACVRYISMAIYRWVANPDKPFVVCFREVLPSGMTNHIKQKNMSVRDYMNHCFGICYAQTTMQTYSYLYELIKQNYNAADLSQQRELKNLKNKIVTGTDNLNYDGLLNLIRQGLAHNNDEFAVPNIEIDDSGDFIFKSRQFADNIVKVSAQDVFNLLQIYMNSAIKHYKEEYVIASNLNLCKNVDKIKQSNSFIKLYRTDSKQEILPDANQEKVLLNLIADYKGGVAITDQNLSFYYPFKANYQNNAKNAVAMTLLFKHLYNNRANTLNDGTLRTLIKSDDSQFFKGLDANTDFLAVLVNSELYNLLTCVPHNKIQPILDELHINIPSNKLRNSIMHGTFFFDKDRSFCLYDGKKKTEQSLSHVGNISMPEIYEIINRIQIDRHYKILREDFELE